MIHNICELVLKIKKGKYKINKKIEEKHDFIESFLFGIKIIYVLANFFKSLIMY
jgi:hypothetical protein